MSSRSFRLLLPAQAIATLMTILVVALAPPASGRILLVPLARTDASHVAARALSGGALLLGSGPLAGSLVVVGDRSAIAASVAGGHVLMLAAPLAGCSEGAVA